MVKINLGCGKRNFGKDWIHIDGGNFDHLNSNDIINFPYNNVKLLYVSHVIAYFDRQEIIPILKKWKRKLSVNGTLRISTPDFSQIQKLYNSKKFNLENFLGPLYGKMEMKNKFIYHKTVYDKESLSALLNNIGFRNIKEWSHKNVSHGNFDDHSQAYLPHFDKKNGTLISVNLECVK
jgi:predicted SAM-dependent methyltransferase